MPSPRSSLLAVAMTVAACTVLAGCGAKEPAAAEGDAKITGGITGLAITGDRGHAIARSTPPALQITIAPGSLACGTPGGGDRIVIDLARETVGEFTVVPGHPYVSFLAAGQARAEVCPAGDPGQQPPCHALVRGGKITVERVDTGAGGLVKGSFHIDLADGSVEGTFTSVRCS